MNLWNFGYATMEQMYEQDYDLIDCNDGHYYIVPNAGYYYDYLKDGKTPSTSQPNTGYLIEKMEAWQKENYEAIIVVTCSADLSGTNNGFI